MSIQSGWMTRVRLTVQPISNPLRIDGSGSARIGDTRVTLETLVRKFLLGDSPEEIADAYLLDLMQVYATISFYLQHRSEVDQYLNNVEEQEARVAGVVEKRSIGSALRQKMLARLETAKRSDQEERAV